MPRLESLDAFNPSWSKPTNQKSGLKVILIVFILLVGIGAVIKKATAENINPINPIDCMSLVDKNGEE